MTYEEFEKAVAQVAELMKEDDFHADGIVGIARGGWIPSRLLSKSLGIKKLYSYGLGYEDAARTSLVTYNEPNPALRNKKLLLVEDFLETGKSLKQVLDILVANGNTVRTVAIGYTNKTIIVPSYTNGLIDEVPRLP